jgi:hypothetical protein
MAFFTQNKAKLFNNLIIALVFEKNANFSPKIVKKSQKIVIITSTPALYALEQKSDILKLFLSSEAPS